MIKFILRIILNGLVLYLSQRYIPGFVLTGGLETIIVGAIVLALLNWIVRPILRIISLPLIWITFGLFNLVIIMGTLWIADVLLVRVTITNLSALFASSLLMALANAFF